MEKTSKEIGIITFHASYNCGSMLQAYALQTFLKHNGYRPEIVDFSTAAQKQLNSIYSNKLSIKALVRNIIYLAHHKRISHNQAAYEKFKKSYFALSEKSSENKEDLNDDKYEAVIAGADQIWNVTIADYDEAYFLPWVKSAKRIAYAPSFGARNPEKYLNDIDLETLKNYLKAFESLSVRENNGQSWIKNMVDIDAPVVLDPTLLLEKKDYLELVDNGLATPENYIFYYSPSYSLQINNLMQKIADKYGLTIIAFNAKSFYRRGMNYTGFSLPEYENPQAYLKLILNAKIVITTSFHGTIFSAIFRKNFWTIKNGEMFGDDDRVLTLVKELSIEDRVISENFVENFDYSAPVDYSLYDKKIQELKKLSSDFLLQALED